MDKTRWFLQELINKREEEDKEIERYSRDSQSAMEERSEAAASRLGRLDLRG